MTVTPLHAPRDAWRAFTIHRDDRGTVPVFWADAPRPFAAGLVFRVGRAFETLAQAGITHLVEHLAIPARTPFGFECNGTVMGSYTTVWAEGEEEPVLAFLREVAERAAALPLDRLEQERGIVLTEADAWSPGFVGAAAALRFGADGHGLIGFPELGAQWLDGDHVAAWASEKFVAPAAAAYMTAEPSEPFELALQPGTAPEVPAPTAVVDVTFPALYTAGPFGGVGVSFVAPRTPEAAVARGVVEKRIRERLRFELGLTYHVQLEWEPLTRDARHGVLVCDCRAGDEREVLDAMLAVLDELADAGPSADELEHEQAEWERALAHPAVVPSFLAENAMNHVLGAGVQQPTELRDERLEVTCTAVAETVAGFLADALVLASIEPPLEGYATYPLTSSSVVSGRTYRLKGVVRRRRPALVVGDEGITWIDDADDASTVRFAECTALQQWVDGTRTVWSKDGTYVTVDPSVWRRGEDIVRALDEGVSIETHAAMEPELSARLDAVAAAIDGKLERGWSTREELDLLPYVLEQGETVVVVARASKGWRAGVVAVTDRRFVFLYLSDVVLELGRDEIVAASRVKAFLCEDKLRLETRETAHVFTDVRPAELLDELVAIVS